MADVKITDYTAQTAPSSTDLIEIVRSAANYKMALGDLAKAFPFGLSFFWNNSVNPTASQTYYMAMNTDGLGASDNNYQKFFIPVTGVVVGMWIWIYIGGTTPSSGNVVCTLRINGSDPSIVVTKDWSTEGTDGAATGDTSHTAAAPAGQRANIKVVTPAWSTAPTGVRMGWALAINASA